MSLQQLTFEVIVDLSNLKSSWLNFITRDIIGDIAFGEPFYYVKAGIVHPWVKIMFSSLRDIVFLAALGHLPTSIFNIIVTILGSFMLGDLKQNAELSIKRVAARVAQGTERKDFMSPILQSVVHFSQATFNQPAQLIICIRANDEKGMTLKEIESSFNISNRRR